MKTIPSKTTERITYTYSDIDTDDPTHKLALSLFGLAGTGKTRLACQAPGRVGLIPMNRKTRETAVIVAKEFDKTIVTPDFDLIRSTNPLKQALLKGECEGYDKKPRPDINDKQPWCCAKHNGRWAVDRTKSALMHFADDHAIDSVVLDGADMFWEDILIAHYGRSERIMPKDRGPANKEMIEIINALADKHFIQVMGAKEVWKNDKPTGKFDWAGFTHLGLHSNCICYMEVDDEYEEGKSDWKFSLTVRLCQANPALIGADGKNLLTDEQITFMNMGMQIYPESDASEWE